MSPCSEDQMFGVLYCIHASVSGTIGPSQSFANRYELGSWSIPINTIRSKLMNTPRFGSLPKLNLGEDVPVTSEFTDKP
jgi:hypothetical protein